MDKFTLFFCSSKNINNVANDIPNPKVGCTTVGEIDKGLFEGIAKYEFDSKEFNIEVVKIPDTKIPVIQTKEIEEAARKVKRNKKNLLAFVLNDGLSADEERIQSLLGSILPVGTPIVGGSSGDGFDFKDTYCCIDSEVFKGAVVILIGTDLKYYIHKENIYTATSKYAVVTKAKDRTIYELDGKIAKNRYAELLGVDTSKVADNFFNHPLGRYHDGEIMISSPQCVNKDGSINLYLASLPSTALWILEPKDYKQEIINTTNEILKRGTPIVTLTVNCILRRILFEQENSVKYINQYLSKINAFGFTSYGEQLNDLHINQTMVTLSFYK